MTPARINSFAQWAEQTYDPSSRPAPKTPMVSALEQLVARKQLDGSVSHYLSLLRLLRPTSSNSDITSTSQDNGFSPPASTQKTTPDRSSRNSPESSATTNPGPIAVREWYKLLNRFEQLDYFVNIKIETFRKHERVHAPLYSWQWWMDWQEADRRRYFYLKYGEEAFWSRYINSNYTGNVEFLFIDPKEVQWK